MTVVPGLAALAAVPVLGESLSLRPRAERAEATSGTVLGARPCLLGKLQLVASMFPSIMGNEVRALFLQSYWHEMPGDPSMTIKATNPLRYLVAAICTLATALVIAAEPGELTQAVLGSDLQAAQRAIDGGAPVDAVDPIAGHTALHSAVSLGGPRYRDMVELLVRSKVRVDTVDATTQLTPLAASMVVTDSGPFAALERSRAANIVDALLSGGANPNQTLKAGESPLMLAVSMNNLSALQLLLARGANPNLRDTQQSTALHVAYALDRPSTFIEALTAAGADPNLRDANSKLPHELSPRFVAQTPPASVVEASAPPMPPMPTSAPAPQTSSSSMNKWLIGGAVVATAIVGSVVLAHLVKEQKKKKASQGSQAVASPILPVTPPAVTPPTAPQPTPAADVFQGKYASQTVLADGYTHTSRALVEGATVALNHEFILKNSLITGSFRWTGTLKMLPGTPARADISGQGVITNQGVRTFTLENASIVVKPNSDIELCWKATDPKYGIIGSCSKRGYVIPDGQPVQPPLPMYVPPASLPPASPVPGPLPSPVNVVDTAPVKPVGIATGPTIIPQITLLQSLNGQMSILSGPNQGTYGGRSYRLSWCGVGSGSGCIDFKTMASYTPQDVLEDRESTNAIDTAARAIFGEVQKLNVAIYKGGRAAYPSQSAFTRIIDESIREGIAAKSIATAVLSARARFAAAGFPVDTQ
jgi:ankyrin repeat protein